MHKVQVVLLERLREVAAAFAAPRIVAALQALPRLLPPATQDQHQPQRYGQLSLTAAERVQALPSSANARSGITAMQHVVQVTVNQFDCR